MKKLILILVSGAIVLLFNTSTLHAQNELYFMPENSDSKAVPIPANELSTKAARHFSKEYSFVQNESWFKIKDGYTAKFQLDDIQYRIGYNKKGNWLNTVRVYREPDLNQAIRHIVKSTYYDYAISLVEELTVKDVTSYVVHIENGKGFKKLYIADGEMMTMDEFSK